MHRSCYRLLVILAILAAALPLAAQQQPDPDSPRYKGVVALDGFLTADDAPSIDEFAAARIATSVRESMGDEPLAAALEGLRAATAGAELRGARPIAELAAELVFVLADGSEMVVDFELDPDDTDRFTAIRSPQHEIG